MESTVANFTVQNKTAGDFECVMQLKNSVGTVIDKRDFSYRVKEAAPRITPEP